MGFLVTAMGGLIDRVRKHVGEYIAFKDPINEYLRTCISAFTGLTSGLSLAKLSQGRFFNKQIVFIS